MTDHYFRLASSRGLASSRLASSRLARAKPARTARALALALAAALQVALAPAHAGEAPTVTLKAGMHLIHAEVADDTASRMRGLMFRTQLAPNHGMLFVFETEEQPCMWMRNTPLPLSVAFLDRRGRIVNVEEMAPQTEKHHCAAGPSRYALEMPAGWFQQHGLGAGILLGGVPGAR
jgi:uncharacterized membrane protein (UPF0127 family)